MLKGRRRRRRSGAEGEQEASGEGGRAERKRWNVKGGKDIRR